MLSTINLNGVLSILVWQGKWLIVYLWTRFLSSGALCECMCIYVYLYFSSRGRKHFS